MGAVMDVTHKETDSSGQQGSASLLLRDPLSLAGCEGGGKGKTLEHHPAVQTKEQSPPCGLWGHREQELGDGAGDQAGGG